jgi:hypothetical protein
VADVSQTYPIASFAQKALGTCRADEALGSEPSELLPSSLLRPLCMLPHTKLAPVFPLQQGRCLATQCFYKHSRCTTLLLVVLLSRPCVSRSGTTMRREPTMRAKCRGGDDSTRRRSTRRAPFGPTRRSPPHRNSSYAHG